MNKFFLRLLLLLGIAASSHMASAQRVAVRTNALDWLTLTPNATVEARLNSRLTLGVGFAVNPVTKPIGGIKTSHFRFEPELRYWLNRPMARHFIAFSPMFADYSLRFNHRNYQGDLYSLGLTYGYALVINDHWNVEFSAGIGAGYTKCYKYLETEERPLKANYEKWIPVPRLGISFAYVFK